MTTEDDTLKIAVISSFAVVIILILAVILTLITVILLRRRYRYRSKWLTIHCCAVYLRTMLTVYTFSNEVTLCKVLYQPSAVLLL